MHIWRQNIVSRHRILLSILQTKVSHVFAGCLKSQKSQIIPADWWFLTCDSIRQSGEPYPWWYSQNRNFPRKMRMANGKIHPCADLDITKFCSKVVPWWFVVRMLGFHAMFCSLLNVLFSWILARAKKKQLIWPFDPNFIFMLQ